MSLGTARCETKHRSYTRNLAAHGCTTVIQGIRPSIRFPADGLDSGSERTTRTMEAPRPTPGEVTELLHRWKDNGDQSAEAQLFSLVQAELLRIARRALSGHARQVNRLDPRELVSEAYLALRDYPVVTTNRAPFFSLMARAMRHFLIDQDRARVAQKRPNTMFRVVDTNVLDGVAATTEVAALDFYNALDALRAVSDRQAQTIELRIVGLSNDEISTQLDVSRATTNRDVSSAKAFMALKLGLASEWISTAE